MMNEPPLVPAMLLPTLTGTPLTAPTISGSLSGSTSFASTLPLTSEFSVVPSKSS